MGGWINVKANVRDERVRFCIAHFSERHRGVFRQLCNGPAGIRRRCVAAVDAAAALTKHISSPVAGAADVLVVPNIEAGNMIYKNLAFMSDAQTARLVVGARVPIVLTSRADTAAARRFSAAAAVLYAHALMRDRASILPEPAE